MTVEAAFPRIRAGQRLTADIIGARNIILVEQSEDVTITNDDSLRDSDLVIPGVAGAVYDYELYVSYSAVREADSGSALVGNWDVPSGVAVNRFATSFPVSPDAGLNTGNAVIMRRPANTTLQIMGGTDTTSPPNNFHSGYDRGTILMGGTAGDVTWRFGARLSVAAETILRGGANHTRLIYTRIL